MTVSRKSPPRLLPLPLLLLPAARRSPPVCRRPDAPSRTSASLPPRAAPPARTPRPAELTAQPTAAAAADAFGPPPGGSRLLQQNSRSPQQFGVVRDLGERTFTDLYFDDPDSSYPLTTRNVWLRTRGCAWNLKVPAESESAGPDGACALSGVVAFHEVDGADRVVDHLEAYSAAGVIRPRSWSDGALQVVRGNGLRTPADVEAFLLTCYNLVPFCSFTTTRRSFVLDDCFRLDLDTADFGHDVGELQLAVPLPLKATREQRRRVLRAAERSLEGFCELHPAYFDRSRRSGKKRRKADDEPTTAAFGILGKLPAYIRRFNPDQWNALVEAKVFDRNLPAPE